MIRIRVLSLCFFIVVIANCAPMKENIDDALTTTTTVSPTKNDLQKKEEMFRKLQRFEGFGYEMDSSVEESDENDGIDFIPVSLQHPLFKVFGINPDEYVVYYKYHRDQDRKQDTDIKFNEVGVLDQSTNNEIMSKKINQKLNKYNLKRAHRHSPILELEEIDEDDFNFEDEMPVELVPTNRKRSYNQNSNMNLQSLYPTPQQQQLQPLSYYPYPGQIYPQLYQPMPYNPLSYQCPPNPCSCNIPTCPQFRFPCHSYQFYHHPGTYKQLIGSNNSTMLQYPDTERIALTRRKRSKILSNNN